MGSEASDRAGAATQACCPDTARKSLPVIEALTPDGWVAAVRDYLATCTDPLAMQDVLTAERRQAWKVFLDLTPGGRLLCLGCELGALAESLAPHAGKLYVLENDMERLRFVQRRLAIFDKHDRIRLLAGTVDSGLPFPDDAFDGVVVAAHAGTSISEGTLKEVRRILRDRGQVIVLGDNRFSLALPAGWWDRWSSLPRPLPSLARGLGLLEGWWRKRNGVESLAGLRGKLRGAGFSGLEALGLQPGRGQLEEILPLAPQWQQSSLGQPWKQRLKRQPDFLPAHAVIAQAGGARRTATLERIIAEAGRQLAQDREPPPLRVGRNVITRKDKLIILAESHDVSLVLRIPFGPAARAAEARNAAMTGRLSEQSRGVSPRPLASGEVDGVPYHVETALPGRPLKRLLVESASTDLLARVETMLETLNPVSSLQRLTFEGAVYERLVEARLERLFQFLPDLEQQHGLRAFFQNALAGAELSTGLVHGDFSGSNIYLSDQKAGIIDWESGAFDDLPVLDAIGYLESTLRPAAPKHSLAMSFRSLARWDLPAAAEKQFLLARYERLGVDPACHAGLVYLRWLRQIDHLLPYWLRYDPAGQDRYVHQVVQSLLETEAK